MFLVVLDDGPMSWHAAESRFVKSLLTMRSCDRKGEIWMEIETDYIFLQCCSGECRSTVLSNGYANHALDTGMAQKGRTPAYDAQYDTDCGNKKSILRQSQGVGTCVLYGPHIFQLILWHTQSDGLI